jgi:hypothetical protein
MSRAVRSSLALLLPTLLLLVAGVAHAHKPSDSYLTLAVDTQGLSGRWDIALRDLDDVLALDADGDRRLTWGEVRTQLPGIDRYVLERLAVAGDDAPCALRTLDHRIDTHTDGAYLVVDLQAACARKPRTVTLSYSLLFDVDPTHRGLLKLSVGDTTHAALFAPGSASARFDTQSSAWRTLLGYLRDGIGHIWTGYDHLLFLCSLLLPAVVVRRSGRWEPSTGLRPVLIDVMRTVTAFTVAHSITLGLAAFGVVQLPSRFVESAIALSVLLAAINNVVCVVDRRRWLVALVFGLVHGFGFASVLSGLDLQDGDRVIALLGFNLGVEAGQLAIVFALLPALYALRETAFYRRAILTAGSCAIAALAAVWLVERSLDIRLGLFS